MFLTICSLRYQGIDGLAGLIFDILQDEGFHKCLAEFVEGLLQFWHCCVYQFHVPLFGEGGSSSFAHFVKEDQDDIFLILVDLIIHSKIGLHGQEPSDGVFFFPREVFWEAGLQFSFHSE